MKKMLVATALLAAFASPAVAQIRTATPDSQSSIQSVYSTTSVTEIVNSDGSVTEITVVRRYYLFGYE